MSEAGALDTQLLRARVRHLEAAIAEANETLDAIRNGDVDAVVVGGPAGQVVYTLENADRPYRVLVEQMKEGALTLGADGTILYCNRSFADLVGRPPAQITGSSFFDLVREGDQLADMLTKPAGESAELSLLTASGGIAPANVSVVELRVEAGASRMLCGIVTDLSQIHRRARELQSANARLAGEIAERTRAEQSLAIALDAADMASWDLSLERAETHPSAGPQGIIGHETPLALWRLPELLEQFAPEDREAVKAAFNAAADTGKVDFEKRILRAEDGALRWVHVKGRAFRGDDGRPARIAGVVTDITERRLIDERLRQSQKMEAIGRLTGGIAHDFNNLLMIIGGSLEAVARRVKLEGRVQELLDAARLGVARGAKLNGQLLAFARRQDMREDVVCINDLLPNFATLLDRAVGETVAVRVARASALWFCRTDPHQLETAILNLAINARDAMGDGGRIDLATANQTVSAPEAARWEAAAGDYVVVSVSDSGCGMDANLVGRVFEPFFTTKGVGKGTGLGLSQVYGFATQSGGFVSIDSEVGRGTTVSIHLPRVSEARVTPPPDSSPRALERAQGVVLLVEDDADVRVAARAMLEDIGYTVREAASGPDALASLQRESPVDLVFSDVIMASGMNGIELAQTIRRRHPGVPVLLTSGYTAQLLPQMPQDQAFPLLRKPYTPDDLADFIGRHLEAARRPAIERPADVDHRPARFVSR